MTDLHQTLCRSRALLIIVDVRKNHLAENMTDYCSKDYYHKYLKSELNITFSKILEQIGNNDTGR